MSTLLVGLAGGAIGSILAGLVAVWSRVSAIPREISANDRAVCERDEDLEQWVTDGDLQLRRDLVGIRSELAASNLIHSGEYGVRIGRAKERALHAYRDQETQARRDVLLIRDREGWMHLCWRQWRHFPPIELAAPKEVEPVLNAWRLAPTKHLSEGDTAPEISDPTRRILADAIAAGSDDFL